jgi:hypothetical protein
MSSLTRFSGGNSAALQVNESRFVEAAPFASSQNQVKRNILQAVSTSVGAPSEKPFLKRDVGGISKKTALLSEAFGLVASLQSVRWS